MNTAALVKDRPPLHTYEPRAQRNFKLESAHLTVALYGSKDGDWSSRQFSLPHDLSKEYRERVGAVLKEQHAGNVHAMVMPREFNARIVDQAHFVKDGVYAGGYKLYRNVGCPGEGLLLVPNESAWLTPSNCGTGILTLEGRCVVVHFGRWSLFDRCLVEHDYRDPNREHESVLYAALEYLGARTKEDAARVVAAFFWGAHPGDFPHPIVDSPHAGINLSLRNHLRSDLGIDPPIHGGRYFGLDLLRVARLQLNKRGVPHKNIDGTFSYLPKTGVWRDGTAGTPRNAVLVIRHN